MEVLLIFIGLAAGLALGTVITVLIMRATRAALNERLSAQQVALASVEQREQQSQVSIADLRASNTSLESEKAGLIATLEQERQQAAKQLALVQQAEQKMKEAFESLAARALNTNNESFLALAKTAFATEQETAKGDLQKREQAIATLVNPVKDALAKVEGKIQDLEVKREGAYSGLLTEVQGLQKTGQQLRSETANLTKVLRSSTASGNWGQIQLRRVVQMAGMLDHCDFFEQVSTDTEDGRLRPDLIVCLPGDLKIVVDAKVPLKAFLEAAEAADDEVRKARLKEHSRLLLKHVSELTKKEYWSQFDQSPDFVVLFLPGEAFFTVAQEQEPELIEMAWDQRIILATPSTLIALLRTIALGWRQEKLAQNAHEISELGRQLYDRLAALAEHFTRLGKNLASSVKSYNEAVGSLENSVFVGARKFAELGASQAADEMRDVDPLEIAVRQFQRPELLIEDTRPKPRLQAALDLSE
jgi:DNA recombination protein RmuC